MQLLLKLVFVTCTLINCVDCDEFTENDTATSTVSGVEINTITQDYITTNIKNTGVTRSSDSNLESAEINSTCIECIHKSPKIENFMVTYTSSKKRILSWDNLQENDPDCEFQYVINSTSSNSVFPYFRRESTNTHVYDNLRICEKYDVLVEAVNRCGYKDAIFRTFYTEPEKISNLSITISQGETKVEWPAAQSQFCSRYRVHANGRVYETEKTSLLVDGSLYCAKIGVQTIRNDNDTSQLYFKTAKPGELSKLNINNSVGGELTIQWEPPEEISCIKKYLVKLLKPNADIMVRSTEMLEETFSDLELCSTYAVQVAASSADDVGEFTEKLGQTPEPDTINPIRNLTSRYDKDRVILSWEPPNRQAECINNYQLKISEEERITTKETTYIQVAVFGCKKYMVEVLAESKSEKVSTSQFIEYEIPPKIPGVPTIVLENVNKTSAMFSVIPDNMENNTCVLEFVKVICEAEVSNSPSWVITFRECEKRIDTNSEVLIQVNVEDLSEFTNYNCTAYFKNSAGWSFGSKVVEITTLSEVPTTPLSFSYTNIDSNKFVLEWKPPDKVPGKLTKYELVITPIQVKSFVPNQCQEPPETETILLDGNSGNFTFDKALPNLRYKCSIRAATATVGFGNTTMLELKTLEEGKPGEVKNLKIDNTKEGILVATWSPPDDTNCIDEYQVKLTQPNSNMNPKEYSTHTNKQTFNNLEMCFTFTISVAAGSKDNMGQYTEKSEETIEPEILNPVINITYNYSNNEAILNWEPPKKEEACILEYQLKISGEEYSSKKPTYTLQGLIGCKTYQIEISGKSKSKLSKPELKEIVIPEIVPSTPSVKLDTVTKTSALFIITPEGREINNCALKRVKVICKAINNDIKPWVVRYKEYEENVSENEKPLSVNVEGLSEFTKYTCNAYLINGAGPSDASVDAIVETNPDVPTTPQMFTFENIDSTTFRLKWEPPYKIPGVLENYDLSIEPLKELHFATENCKESPEPVILLLNANTKEYTYLDALPNYKYKCSLRARTIDFGNSVTLELNTLSGVPDQPIDFSRGEIDNQREPKYNASVILNWMYPCKTRGAVKHFVLSIAGKALEDRKRMPTITMFVPPNENIENVDYAFKFFDLQPSHEYVIKIKTVLITGQSSEENELSFNSPDGYPSPPMSIVVKSISKDTFDVTWKPPVYKNGHLLNYTVTIKSLGPIHEVPNGCEKDFGQYKYIVEPDELFYQFKEALVNYKYEVIVVGTTKSGEGFPSGMLHGTPSGSSEPVSNLLYHLRMVHSEEYNSFINITFGAPCNLNGPLSYYEISLQGTNQIDKDEQFARTEDLKYSFVLKPEFKYKFTIDVVTDCCRSGPIESTFTSPAGVPPITLNASKPSIQNIEQNTVSVAISNDLFGFEAGEIMYYAIFLTGSEKYLPTETKYGFWDLSHWPNAGTWKNDTDPVEKYQATPIRWNPFNTKLEFILGNDTCTSLEEYCNGPLRPNTKYYMEIRGFTKNAYRDSEAIIFTIPPIEDLTNATNVVKIIGIIMALLAFILICGIAIYLWKRKRAKPIENSIESQDIQYKPIGVKQFPRYYYDNLQENEQILKNEYLFLNALSSNELLTTSEALLTENRKKNRYINILPYDDIRVVLDDDLASYINASYIKGYSDRVEYIATQGPLKSTYLDFWKMILQENVTVVVMVAHFIEQEKEKCFKYIPDDQEPMEVGDDIKIRCAAKLDFTSHCERHIKIQTNDRKHEVTHLQFLNWPDFGCPSGTENMLNFCEIMRSQVKEDPGKIVVHCSAGVGRTGTLIALDILLQTINQGQDIDVFNTVLSLRKQRKNMVQTQPQYQYIYTCLYDAIMDPPLREIKADEPTYENVKTGIEMKVFKSDSNENIETD